jgi:hypothetical protein
MMMIEGEGAAVATEAVTVLTATETGLATDTGTETGIDVVMISIVEKGADLIVTAMSEIDEERGMIWTTLENKMTAPRGSVKMMSSKIKLLSRTVLAVTARTVILEMNTMNALGLVEIDVIVVVKMKTTRT